MVFSKTRLGVGTIGFKKILTIALVNCWSFLMNGQVASTFLFSDGLTKINAAQIGLNSSIIRTSFTNQWDGIVNGPKNNWIHAELLNTEKPIAMGVFLGLNTSFIESRTPILGQFAYALTLSENLKLRLGIQTGGTFFNIAFSDLESVDGIERDLLLQRNAYFKPSFGVGLYLSHTNFFLSLAIPELLETHSLEENEVFLPNQSNFLVGGGFQKRFYNKWELNSAIYYYRLYSDHTVFRSQIAWRRKAFQFMLANENVNRLILGFQIHRKKISLGYGYFFPTTTNSPSFHQKKHHLFMLFQLTKNKVL